MMFPSTSMPDADWWTALWPNPDAVITASLFESDSDAREVALDLCCGDGLFTVSLAKIYSRVHGVDLDSDLINSAKTRCEGLGLTNVNVYAGDAMKIDEQIGDSFDAVFIANTFHGIPDKDAILQLLKKKLTSTGKIVVVNWYKRPREETTVLDKPRGPPFDSRMNPEDTTAIFNANGLNLFKVVDVSPYHYAAVYTL